MINPTFQNLTAKFTLEQGAGTPGMASTGSLQLNNFNDIFLNGSFSSRFLGHFLVNGGELTGPAAEGQQQPFSQLPDGKVLPPLTVTGFLSGDDESLDGEIGPAISPIPLQLIPVLEDELEGLPGQAVGRATSLGADRQHPVHPLSSHGGPKPGFVPPGLEHYPIDNPGNGRHVLNQLMNAGEVDLDLAEVKTEGGDNILDAEMSRVDSVINPNRQLPGNQHSDMIKVSLNTPVQQPRWGEALTSRIAWMVAENHQSAQINLNPPELGPIEVRLSLHHDKANINFYVHHQDVREAIEQAFPRLRDMLSQNGFSLEQGHVSQHPFSQQHQQGREGVMGEQRVAYQYENSPELPEENSVSAATPIYIGYIDQYV